MRVPFSLLFWSYLALSSVVLGLLAIPLWLLTLPFDPRRVVLHRFTCWWGFHYVQLCPFWRISIEGRDRVPGGACILVANHQSLGDVLAILGLRAHFKFVAKAVLFHIPFIGWNMRMNRYVSLVRGDRNSIKAMLDRCRAHVREGSSLLLFPEGTRSPDGEIQSFKRGAFALAIELQVPVVPVVIDGMWQALPRSGWVFRNTGRIPLTVRVLEPVTPPPSGTDHLPLAQAVHETMVAELALIRGDQNQPGAV